MIILRKIIILNLDLEYNQDNYNDKRIFYNSIKSNYLEYNRFIQGYTQNIKIQV